jgi:hypothetical protein
MWTRHRGWVLLAILAFSLVSGRPQGEGDEEEEQEDEEEEDEGGDEAEYDYDLVGADGGIVVYSIGKKSK